MLHDTYSEIEIKRAIAPTRVADNTVQTGVGIDLANFGSVTFAVAIGTLADADATFTVEVQDSNDNSTYAAVDDAFLLGTEALATGASFQFDDDNECRKIGYIGPKRYVRLVVTPANNAGNADLSAVAILGRPRKMPRSSQQT